MRNFGGRKTFQSEINITSLIDVIFMLVVFFMIGARFEKPAIALTLPKASSGTIEDRIFITVSVDADGRIYVEGAALESAAGSAAEKESLAARFAAYGHELSNITVALECDGQAVFDRVAAVMDIIRNAGVRNVAIRHEW